MIISRNDRSNRSNFEDKRGESRNFKRGFGDLGENSGRSEKSYKNRREGDEFGSGDRDYSRKSREFDGRRNRDNDQDFTRKPRRSFDDRNDLRGGKRIEKDENDFERRDRSSSRNRSFDFDKAERSFGGERDGFRGKSERGDRDDRGNRDRSFRSDRADKGFSERPPKVNRERSERGFGDRSERNSGDREERGFGDRTERGFGDRPPRSDRIDKFGDRTSRGDRTERGFGDRIENREKRDSFKDRENRFNNKEKIFESNASQRSFREKEKKGSGLSERDENFEKIIKFDEEKYLGSEDSVKTDASFKRENKEFKKRVLTPKNLDENSKLNSAGMESDLTKISSQESEIDLNKITLALLKNKKESEMTKVNEKEEITKKDEETVEFRDTKKDYLYGMHSVQAALTYNFRKNLELLIDQNYKENIPDHIQKILELAKNKEVKLKHVSRDRLDKLTGGRPHNGVVLKSDIRDYIYLNNFSFIEKFIIKPEGNLLILLDQIVDPQNFGSVIRSAFFLGADAIMLNRKNKPPISSTVCKVSSGASECVDLFAVKSLRPFLKEAADKGWTVITTSIEKESDVQLRLDGAHHVSNGSQIVRESNETTDESNEKTSQENTAIEAKTVSLHDLSLSNKNNIILILGSEASGITSNLSGLAHYNIFIPPLLSPEETGKHPFTLIDSLNVGVSAGIIINHIKTQLKNVNFSTDKI